MKTVSVCFFLNTIVDGKCGRMVFRDRSLFVAWGGGGGGEGGRRNLGGISQEISREQRGDQP